MIESRSDQVLATSVTGLKVNTMYAAAQDALKWLADNIPPSEGATINKYAVLRTQISMTRTDTTVELYFKNTVVNAMTSETLHKAQPGQLITASTSELLRGCPPHNRVTSNERNIILRTHNTNGW